MEHHPKQIIVRVPNWIGDHVMALGFYRNLRSHYSQTRITWLMKDPLKTLSLRDLCDDAWVLSGSLFNDLKRIREGCFDLSISLPATLSSAILFFLSGIPERSGFSNDGNDLFYTSHIPWRGRASYRHKADLYLDLFEYVSHASAVTAKISKSPLARNKKILIAPGASIGLREWPYFEELIDALLQNHPDHTITIVGSKESVRWHETVNKKKSSNITDLIGKTTLDQLVVECETSALVICNDSGVGHIAASLARAKTIVLFGPGDPAYIAPHGDVIPLRGKPLPCSPCEKPYCHSIYGYQACLKSLTATDVLRSVHEILSS